MDETVVRCGSCKTLLAEPSDTPVENRVACRKCGSMSRHFEVHVRATLALEVRMSADGAVETSGESSASIDVRRTGALPQLGARNVRLEWLRLSPGGAWMLRVFDEDGNFIDGTIQDDPEDAVLAVAETLAAEATDAE